MLRRIVFVFVAVLSLPLAAEKGFLGLFGALGGNTYQVSHYVGHDLIGKDPLTGGFGWGLGIEGYMGGDGNDIIGVRIPLYVLSPSLTYLAVQGSYDLLSLFDNSRGTEVAFLGIGFGLGNLTRWDEDGVDGSTFAFDVHASGALISLDGGSLWMETGFVFANTMLTDSNYNENEWYLMVGASIGIPWKKLG